MLNALRSRSSGIVAKIILALLIVSFALWGIGDMVRNHGQNPEVARVGSLKITSMDVEREMQTDIAQLRERLGQNYKPEIVKMINLPMQVVQRMISQEVVNQEIKSLGILVSDSMVAELIRANKAFGDDMGKFNKEKFTQVLKQNNMTEADYVGRVKQDMATRLISQAVVGYSEVPEMAVKVMLAAEKETRNVTVYAVDTSKVKAPEPNDDELKAYFNSVSERYATPEFRSVSYVEIDESMIGEAVKVSDEDLQHVYQERKEEFSTPEYRSFEQLLYTGKDQALKAAELLKAGKTAAEIAKELPPINIGNLVIKQASETALPEALRVPAFALALNEVSAPVQSSFGFHVIKLTKLEPATTKPFEQVKAQLEKELKPTKMSEALTAKANQLEDMMAGGSTLSEAAKTLGLTVKKVEMFSKNGKSPNGAAANIPPLNNFAVVAFATEAQSDSTVTLGRPGVYYLLHVDQVEAEKLPPIESVKTELVKSWQATRLETLKKAEAESIAAKMADMKQRAEVLASGAVRVFAKGSLKRSDTTLSGRELSAGLVQDVFNGSVGDITTAHLSGNGTYVIADIETSQMPALLSNDAQATNKDAIKMQQTIRSNIQQELMAQYMQSLTEKYGVHIDEPTLATIGAE